MTASNFFSSEQQQLILNAISGAEKNTSGEVRVHLENSCKEDVLDRAAYIFAKLNMHKTELRNGVLFYLAIKDRKFAILGDAGINSKVPNGFWDEIKVKMASNFKEGKFLEGLVEGISMTGAKLKEHFPCCDGDVNELSNEISFGK